VSIGCRIERASLSDGSLKNKRPTYSMLLFGARCARLILDSSSKTPYRSKLPPSNCWGKFVCIERGRAHGVNGGVAYETHSPDFDRRSQRPSLVVQKCIRAQHVVRCVCIVIRRT
jgi:hypothetical protein